MDLHGGLIEKSYVCVITAGTRTPDLLIRRRPARPLRQCHCFAILSESFVPNVYINKIIQVIVAKYSKNLYQEFGRLEGYRWSI